MKTVIIMDACLRMAKQRATDNYGLGNWIYVKPYRYASKGNNFYEFQIISYPSHETP